MLITSLSRIPRTIFNQNENINILNVKRIKLEDSVQLKTAAINNILRADLGTVNMLEQMAMDNTAEPIAPLPEIIDADNFDVYCAAILIVSKRNVVAKLSWIKDISYAKSMNNGLRTSLKRVIFYSSLIGDGADFTKPIAGDFIDNEPALYVAKIHRFFGRQFLRFVIPTFCT